MGAERLTELFGQNPSGLLSVFYTAGFPQLDDTVQIGRQLGAAGADLIEIGIPFSDPIADGPVIQDSNKVALSNGMTVPKLLDQVRELRNTVSIPVILMGYLNPVLQYGFDRFCKDASDAGVDGLILPDLPLDEYESQYRETVDRYKLALIFLVSPTTAEERIRRIDGLTTGFIYAVAANSTTGARQAFSEEQVQYFQRLKNMKLKHPFLIGFGISDHPSFTTACQYGAGAIVGSAFIGMLKNSGDKLQGIEEFVKSLKPA
ncbi:MAG: tryptophan synthase subunit alpha [Bacteroidetes bacterium]|nr:tryptophan synthase subunit alpha [Bacteroidota bacterium]